MGSELAAALGVEKYPLPEPVAAEVLKRTIRTSTPFRLFDTAVDSTWQGYHDLLSGMCSRECTRGALERYTPGNTLVQIPWEADIPLDRSGKVQCFTPHGRSIQSPPLQEYLP